MSPVEAFATGIKMESSDQRSFRRWSRNQDEFWATNINRSTHFLRYLAGMAMFVLWTPVESSDQQPRNGAIKRSRTIFTDQDSWSRSQMLLWATCMWLPLAAYITTYATFYILPSSTHTQSTHLYILPLCPLYHLEL